jgi:predicted DNA repair protein MutK
MHITQPILIFSKRDVERAERVAAKAMSLVESGEQATTPYILLGNTYLATENYEKAREVTKHMDEVACSENADKAPS